MKSFIKYSVVIIIILSLLFVFTISIYFTRQSTASGKPYRVEAERIALKLRNGEAYDLSDYKYIKKVEIQNGSFSEENRDYLIKDIGGVLYRFDYEFQPEKNNGITIFAISYSAVMLTLAAGMLWVYFRMIRPFEKLRKYPKELAKGNLTIPLKQRKNGFYTELIWGLDLLREKLEKQKAAELEMKKRSKTMVLSLSHDIKTPLSVIELYSKALEKGLYKDEEKKKSIAVNINAKCEEIRGYVDGIVRTETEDFVDLEVKNGEFYLDELVRDISSIYKDKLELLKTDLHIENHSDCLLSGDRDRAEEIIQNLIENAVKYGDGKNITISFSSEEGCRLIHVENTGCTLPENELPHIFESFWRGSNAAQETGSGLGLYICRSLIRKMNGEIFAEIKNGSMTVSVVFRQA